MKKIVIKIAPNEKSFYHNSLISFSFKASEDYPYQPPEVMCMDRILHPNIDLNGNVCLSIINKDDWKPINDLYHVVVGLMSILQNLSPDDIAKPLDVDAAELMHKSLEEFRKVVQETIMGKSHLNRKFDKVYYTGKRK